jgi:hypothetical protein
VRSPVVQKDNQNNLKINIYAEPYWKKEVWQIKTLFAVYCNPDWIFHGTPPPPLTLPKN